MKTKVLLLDLDGTLINSEYAFYNCFKDSIYNDCSKEVTFEEYTKYELERNAMLLKYIEEKYKNKNRF